MSATAEEIPDADVQSNDRMCETVAYEPKAASESGPEDSMGSPDMPIANSSPQAQGRYTFGSGARPLDGYTIKRAIGRGGFGEVYYATSDSGKEVALKLILRNLDVERRGVLQCMNLKCPNLLTIFDLKTSDAGDTFVVMEYVSGSSLAAVLKQHPTGLPLAEVRHWLKGLVEGVAYLHDHGIVHRDLKPANLFMEEGIVKIGDYGLAKLITPSHGTEHSESIGTCHYMAPEIGSGKYNKPIDVYAIGIILYEMITGRVPFDGETVNEVLMKHLTARPDISVLPQPYQTIVAKALAKDPSQRPSHIYNLLPPEDAPQAPEVRIIGDGKAGGTAAHREDDVLRIEAEEPIFYIGPDTRPPRAANLGDLKQKLRANWEALRRPGRYAAQPPPPRRTGAQFVQGVPRANPAARRAAYAIPVAAAHPQRALAQSPPEPPELPSGRVRFAELAASMLCSAPLLALLVIPVAAILGIDPSTDTQHLAYLFGMALVGTWIAVVPPKALETRRLDGITRRLISLAGGLSLGAIGTVLGQNLQIATSQPVAYVPGIRGHELIYFGALFALTGSWWRMAARDRKSRFRIMPVLWTALLAMILTPFFWPHVGVGGSEELRFEGMVLAVLIAMAVQLVSPWNQAASLYAQYVRASKKQKCKSGAVRC
jgi:serine/threonine protein kinase